MSNFLSLLMLIIFSTLQILFGGDAGGLVYLKSTSVTENVQTKGYETVPVTLNGIEWGISADELTAVLGEADSEESAYGTKKLIYNQSIETVLGTAQSISFSFGETGLKDLKGNDYTLGLSIIEAEYRTLNYEQAYEMLKQVYGSLESTSMLARPASSDVNADVFAEKLGAQAWQLSALDDDERAALEALFKQNSPDYILLPEELLTSVYIMGENRSAPPVTVRFDVSIALQLRHALD